MRTVYLIRHGSPDFPDGRRMCLGQTDLPLSVLGRLQSALAGASLENADLSAVYCSRLLRSRQTAEAVGPAAELPGLEELSAGQWDGLFFDQIRERWPALFALRGRDLSVSPPGAESRESGLARFSAALNRALAASQGDIAISSHASVMQTFLCPIMGLSLAEARGISLPYGSVTRLSFENGVFTLLDAGVLPHPEPNAALCLRLLDAAGAPQVLSAHCAAVAEEALNISRALSRAGIRLDDGLVLSAALLHDIARGEKDHAAVGAAWLTALGYPEQADVIRQHGDLDDPARIDEAAVVFIADKLVRGAERVDLRERFSFSREKCVSAGALAAHDRRYAAALTVAGGINSLCGKDVVR